ncbi:EAL domain-containing protein [Luteimonas vadosa]|uniref:EAL domain-containing protein n=1 Tax=Luteimonas vadosa TaxID=1165507 RepID=A0ABP9DSG3_9GAMM
MAAIRRELFHGEVLFRQGDPSDCAWLIESGVIELAFEHAGERIAYGELGPGELLGELGVLEGTPRSASAIARGETVLLSIDHDQFLERLDKADPIVRALVGGLRRRTRSLLAALPDDVVVPAEDLPRDDADDGSGTDKIRLEAQLREALSEEVLRVRYQPIYDIRDQRVSGYEALVRWDLPGRGAVSPVEFIKLAEETSLIVPVGEYVLDRVIALLSDLCQALPQGPLPSIAVNLSARQLVEPGMARQIVSRIDRAGLPPGALKLEVTESRMLDYGHVASVMAHCRQHGVPFALDDFGTGYSNLTHLHKLDFELVKVDQAFSRHMFDSPKAMAIVDAIVAMAHGIGAEVVVEGVETTSELRRLRELGVRYAQGYLIGQAQGAEAVLSGEAARIGALL